MADDDFLPFVNVVPFNVALKTTQGISYLKNYDNPRRVEEHYDNFGEVADRLEELADEDQGDVLIREYRELDEFAQRVKETPVEEREERFGDEIDDYLNKAERIDETLTY